MLKALTISNNTTAESATVSIYWISSAQCVCIARFQSYEYSLGEEFVCYGLC